MEACKDAATFQIRLINRDIIIDHNSINTFINPIHESSSFQILLCQVKLPNMVAKTIYGLKELLMHVPEPMGTKHL